MRHYSHSCLRSKCAERERKRKLRRERNVENSAEEKIMVWEKGLEETREISSSEIYFNVLGTSNKECC